MMTESGEGEIDQGNAKFGMWARMPDDSGNVFVPWERVFMCGETDYVGLLVERWACYHRQNYGGCKAGFLMSSSGRQRRWLIGADMPRRHM